ncbi:3944_t:CDS:1, partial [Gigaspora rosea]
HLKNIWKRRAPNETAKRVGLRRRMVHRIVPKRLGINIEKDEQNNFLSFEDEKNRHLWFDVGVHTFLERYVDWLNLISSLIILFENHVIKDFKQLRY